MAAANCLVSPNLLMALMPDFLPFLSHANIYAWKIRPIFKLSKKQNKTKPAPENTGPLKI